MVVVNVCQGTKENNVKIVRTLTTVSPMGSANPATAMTPEFKKMVNGAATQMVDVNVKMVTKELNVMSVRMSGI